MQISYASEGAAGHANEDYALCGNNWAVIFDGATPQPGIDTGCVHDVPWLVHQFAAALAPAMLNEAAKLNDAAKLNEQGRPLADILADGIERLREQHAGTCDLANPDSPSTTVSMVRISGSKLDYLTLGDSPIVVWDNGARVFLDDRLAHLPGGRPYTRELVRSCRNQPGGFWVASTDPHAAYQAKHGSMENAGFEVGLFTDGAARLVDFYRYSWDALFELLRRSGPANLIATVRAKERENKPPHDKQHDDATAIHITTGTNQEA